MDFHTLSRKELQALCKKNKIPANITNVAMADALSALPDVEGLDEILNPIEAEGVAETPMTHRGAAPRTATRKKPVREEPPSSKVVSSQRPQRGTRRAGNGDGAVAFEQENKDANVIVTPAAKKRAPAVSLRRKKEVEAVEDDEEKIIDLTKTPSAVPSSRARATGASRKTEGTSVGQGYNTRRSVRLLEKNLSQMSLMDAEDNGAEKIDEVSEEISSFSQQIEDSADTEEVSDAGANLKAVADVVLEESHEQEVSSMEMKTESELPDLSSEVQVVSVKEIDVEPQMEAESEHKGSSLKSDFVPNETKLEGSSEALEHSNGVDEVSDAGANLKAVADVVLEETHEQEVSSMEMKTESELPDLSSEVQVVSVKEIDVEPLMEAESEQKGSSLKSDFVPNETKLEGSSEALEHSNGVDEVSDAGANLKAVADVVLEETHEQEVSSMEMKTESELPDLSSEVQVVSVKEIDVEPLMEAESEQKGSSLKSDFVPNETKLEGSSEALEHSNGVDEGSESLSEQEDGDKTEDEKDLASPEGVIEQNPSNVSSSDEPLKEDCEVKFPHSEVLSSEVVENIEEDSEITLENCEESLEGGLKMDTSDLHDVPSAVASENLTVNVNSELLEKSSMLEEEELTDGASDVTGALSAEEYETEDEEYYSSDVTVEGAHVEDLTLQSSVLNDNQGILEAKSEPLEDESMVAIEKVVDGASSAAISLEKDASESYVNFIAAQVCTESSADVSLESSLVHVAVQEAEQKDNSESNDDAAAEEIADSLSVPSLNPEKPLEGDHSSEVVIADEIEHEKPNVHAVAEDVASDDASLLSFNYDTAVKGDDSSEVVIEDKEQNEEPNDDGSMHVLSFNPNMPVKASNTPIKSVVAEQSKGETKVVANETQTVESLTIMKENLTTDELQQKSMRKLRKMMKKLGLNNNNTAGKEVKRKRTALQVLPENQNTPKAATNQ